MDTHIEITWVIPPGDKVVRLLLPSYKVVLVCEVLVTDSNILIACICISGFTPIATV